MIKSELITQLTKKLPQIPEKDIAMCVGAILDQLSESLGSGNRIEIRGFGSFSLHYHAPRNAHNPKTGAKVVTSGKYTPHFKPGKELRERVNDSRLKVDINDSDNPESDEDSSGSQGDSQGGGQTWGGGGSGF
jgi:integration host factor subunit beta